MSQKILNIKLEDLVLWSENPRDPISSGSNNQDVANKALQDKDEAIRKEFNALRAANGKKTI